MNVGGGGGGGGGGGCGGGGGDDDDDAGAFQSVYCYSPFQCPVPCVTVPKRYPLATCSNDQDKHSYEQSSG